MIPPSSPNLFHFCHTWLGPVHSHCLGPTLLLLACPLAHASTQMQCLLHPRVSVVSANTTFEVTPTFVKKIIILFSFSNYEVLFWNQIGLESNLHFVKYHLGHFGWTVLWKCQSPHPWNMRQEPLLSRAAMRIKLGYWIQPALSIHRGLFPGPPQVPKSMDVQVPSNKLWSTVNQPCPQLGRAGWVFVQAGYLVLAQRGDGIIVSKRKLSCY